MVLLRKRIQKVSGRSGKGEIEGYGDPQKLELGNCFLKLHSGTAVGYQSVHQSYVGAKKKKSLNKDNSQESRELQENGTLLKRTPPPL